MRTLHWSTIVALFACATARADIRNPDIRNVQPEMAFAGVQNHPDHVFLIHVRDKGYWGPNVEFESRVIPIPGLEPFKPGFRNTIERVEVLAVPTAVYEKLPEDQRQALSAKPHGVLSSEIKTPSMTIGARERDPDVIRYRVSIADGKLRVDPDAPADRDSSRTRPGGSRRAWWGTALAAWLGLIVVRLGLVVGRRLVRGES